MNVKKGIAYVEEALKIEPDSAYYLDSLAWGYYKLQKCSEAAKIMKKIRTMQGGDNEEVVKHLQMIEECEKIQKRKKEQK
jgi:tetratricopeptide (TPR) repeat protein